MPRAARPSPSSAPVPGPRSDVLGALATRGRALRRSGAVALDGGRVCVVPLPVPAP